MKYLCLKYVLTFMVLMLALTSRAKEPVEGDLVNEINQHLEREDVTACLELGGFPRYADAEISNSPYSISKYQPFIQQGLMTAELYSLGNKRPAQDTSPGSETMLMSQYFLMLTPNGQHFYRITEPDRRNRRQQAYFCFGKTQVAKIDSWVIDANRLEVKYLVKVVQRAGWSQDAKLQTLYQIDEKVHAATQRHRYISLRLTNQGWRLF